MNTIHPRPNPIIAAMYTLRDMNIDVIVIHGPAGCGFMAARMLEEAGIRVVTSGMKENDLVFGGSESLINTLKAVKEKFDPKTVAVVGTCSSMIIGEDMEAIIFEANIGCNVFPVNCNGCMGDNTKGAIAAINAASAAGIISKAEAERQANLLTAATLMERSVGMASKDYLSPTSGPTKFKVSKMIVEALKEGKKMAVVMLAKKELAYRFADIFLAVSEAQKACGGSVFFVANLDASKGLPRIRGYAVDILSELAIKGVKIDIIIGGLDEYAIIGEEAQKAVESYQPDMSILVGIPHAYPKPDKKDIMITDQPRQLTNYLNAGYDNAVGEISSHSRVMGTHKIVPLETGDTIRELLL